MAAELRSRPIAMNSISCPLRGGSRLGLILGAASLYFSHASTSSALGPDAPYAIVGGALATGALTATSQIEQTYYLGSIDPENRIAPAFFRIRVKGQSSFINNMKFGSGWVHAYLVDTLSLNPNDVLGHGPSSTSTGVFERMGSGMIEYGPEGFRRLPEQNRLVIVMGANPQAFFQAVDAALGIQTQSQPNPAKAKLARLGQQRKALAELRDRLGPVVAPSPTPTPTPTPTSTPTPTPTSGSSS